MELEPEDEGDDAEDETSLGCLEQMNQERSWTGSTVWEVDRELDNSNDEPTLGSLDQHDNQERWAAGGRQDLEQDPAEAGIGDFDGLAEQVGSQDWQQGVLA